MSDKFHCEGTIISLKAFSISIFERSKPFPSSWIKETALSTVAYLREISSFKMESLIGLPFEYERSLMTQNLPGVV